MNKNNMQIEKLIIIFISALIFLFVQPSEAIELEKCKKCHEAIEPISKSNIIKDCNICHTNHNMPPRDIRDPEIVHSKHVEIWGIGSREKCGPSCHKFPPECTKCHNIHKTINISKEISGIKNVSNCNDCHGKLPQPKGHTDFLDALLNSKHRWMNCDTCHINLYDDTYKYNLRFKDLFSIQINESTELCKICHSSQYERLKEGIHGTKDKKCVDCHSPHTTTSIGPKFRTVPKETPANISTSLESTKKWITTKVPILNSPIAVFIIIIVMIVTIAEHILSRQEEGTKTAYNMVKVRSKEDSLKTLEVKLKDNSIDVITDILWKNGVDVLGMTMTKEKGKEEDKGLDLYIYVIFIDTDIQINDNDLINKISSIGFVKSADITDKYEL